MGRLVVSVYLDAADIHLLRSRPAGLAESSFLVQLARADSTSPGALPDAMSGRLTRDSALQTRISVSIPAFLIPDVERRRGARSVSEYLVALLRAGASAEPGTAAASARSPALPPRPALARHEVPVSNVTELPHRDLDLSELKYIAANLAVAGDLEPPVFATSDVPSANQVQGLVGCLSRGEGIRIIVGLEQGRGLVPVDEGTIQQAWQYIVEAIEKLAFGDSFSVQPYTYWFAGHATPHGVLLVQVKARG